VTIRRVFTATLPSLLALSALAGALGAIVFPSGPIDRPTPHAAARVFRAGNEIRPAIHTSDDQSPDQEAAWTQLVATFELVQSSQAVLEEAQSLRAIAAALAAGPAEPERAHRELAEGQLALADKVLRMAQAHAANAQAAFGMAWQNVQRASQENSYQAPAEPLRESAFHGRRPG
jgi:hypothetical protein